MILHELDYKMIPLIAAMVLHEKFFLDANMVELVASI